MVPTDGPSNRRRGKGLPSGDTQFRSSDHRAAAHPRTIQTGRQTTIGISLEPEGGGQGPRRPRWRILFGRSRASATSSGRPELSASLIPS
jgi:hypothetical protein